MSPALFALVLAIEVAAIAAAVAFHLRELPNRPPRAGAPADPFHSEIDYF